MHSTTSSPTLHLSTRRKMSDSRPSSPTAVAAMVRFCGLIILPTTPPEVFAATSSVGSMPGLLGGGLLQGGEQGVGAGVRAGDGGADPAQDRGQEGEERAGAGGQPLPMVMVWPDRFIT